MIVLNILAFCFCVIGWTIAGMGVVVALAVIVFMFLPGHCYENEGEANDME